MKCLFHVAFEKGPDMSIHHGAKSHEEDIVVNYVEGCSETNVNL
jgi:hypothetical protein